MLQEPGPKSKIIEDTYSQPNMYVILVILISIIAIFIVKLPRFDGFTALVQEDFLFKISMNGVLIDI